MAETITVPCLIRQAPELIRQERMALGWSQTELAKACSMNAAWISNIETRAGKPTDKTLGRILAVFGYEVDDGAIYRSESGPTWAAGRRPATGLLSGPGRPIHAFVPSEPITTPVSPERLADLIRQQRTARRWSQKKLAKDAGVTAAWVSRVENRHDMPTVNMLNRVLPLFGYEFLDGSARPKSN